MNISPARAFVLLLAATALGCATPAHAGEAGIQLKEAPQSVQVRARCSICHSADYIQMNSVFMNKTTWEAEVRKMIKVMGAPIPETEVAEIVDYLVKNYGVE